LKHPALRLIPLVLLCTALPAAADPGAGDTGEPEVEGCSDQFLVDGAQLPENPDLYYLMSAETAWGTPEMVDLVIDAAVRMKDALPEASPLAVGDISRRRGGFLAPHKQHRGGLDVDLGVYRTGAQQPRGILPFPASDFDLPANFLLISTLLATDQVEMILLDQTHISRLRAWAVTNELLSREEAERWFPRPGTRLERSGIGVVRHAPGHDGHLHVRVLCADGTRAR